MSKYIKALSRKWTLQILSFMLKHEEVRYKEIEVLISNPRTSSRLLKELTQLGLISRKVLVDRTVSYKLTSMGRELMKLVDKISQLESQQG